ncbi:MAG: efflux RND transporter periplasmic adaptor subunit [Anaerolineales bacterium]|nr:efflux RND transporter periplasmic adaptor subunit [Anaerolineales bacterium]
MKKVLWMFFGVLAITVTACAKSATPATIPTVSLDSGSQQPVFSNVATASGTVVPVKKAELAFPIAGIVKTVEVAEGDSVSANQPLVTLEPAILEAKVREAEANVLVAETQVAYLVRSGTSQENLDSAKADVERMKALVGIAEAQLAQATLNSPFDGTIASVDISPSEYVNSGQVVISMGDLSHFQIETTDLSEKVVPSVKVGAQATVFIEALNNEFTGKVVDIARISETVGGDVVYKVTIELDKQPAGLRWGMSTDVTIQAQK